MDVKELAFAIRVTRIYRKNIDLLIELSDEHLSKSLVTLSAEIPVVDDAFSEASFYISDSPRISFSLYALAVIHCYSLLENNRADILLRLPGLSKEQKKGLHKIKVVEEVFSSIGLLHGDFSPSLLP